ncbi:MAG: hypothetical protein LBP35_01750 [Candidatus Ancillula trichonymphae]|nr:hypothetical protein [Candidatus Ancillula trichonymphae]
MEDKHKQVVASEFTKLMLENEMNKNLGRVVSAYKVSQPDSKTGRIKAPRQFTTTVDDADVDVGNFIAPGLDELEPVGKKFWKKFGLVVGITSAVLIALVALET